MADHDLPHENRSLPMKRICGAKTRNGTPCQRAPAVGRNRCKLHGGASLRGVASPHFKTGRYSRYLPQDLAKRYHESLNDPDLLNLSSELSLIDARLTELLGRVTTGESGALFRRLSSLWTEMTDADVRKDFDAQRAALHKIGEVIQRGLGDGAAWEEIDRLVERRRKLTESEGKRRIAMSQMLTPEQAATLVAALEAAVKEHVHDRETLRRIAEEISRFRGARPPYD